MQVTRVEIFGFKSFMERVILPLESGITAIVGPNGCGKSNVVDAVRWVLGETRAKSLRGGVLEDVIFNGTDRLRPLGLAEVTITLRANSENFFADLVSPALEADSIARGALDDKEPCSHLQGDEAVGVDENIVIDSVLSAGGGEGEKPRLTVITGGAAPEADPQPDRRGGADLDRSSQSGETGETGSSPGVSVTLINRFAWLRSVSEIQVTRRLYRSGESEFFINRVPCRLKDLKDLFLAVNLSARAYSVVAQGEVARMVTARPEERRLIIEEAAGVLGLRDKIATAERRLEETATNISRLDDVLREVGRQVNSLKRQASRARARNKLKERLAEADRELFLDKWASLDMRGTAAATQHAEHKTTESSMTAAFQAARAGEQAARSELVAVDVEGDALRGRIDSLREELSERTRRRTRKESRSTELSSLTLSCRSEMERLEDRRRTLLERQEVSRQELESLALRDTGLSEEINAIDKGSDEELRAAAEELRLARIALQGKERELRGCREELVRSGAGLEAIKKQLVAASPANQLKKTLGGEGRILLEEVCEKTKLFVDGITVPAHYANALQAVLAERAGFLVSDNPYRIARSFAEKVLAKDPKNMRGLGLGIFHLGCASAAAVPHAAAHPPFARLIDQLSIQDNYRAVADRLLDRVYVVDSLAAALDFFEDASTAESRQGVTLVTVDGDLVTDISFFTLRHEGGIVQLRNEAVRLEKECRELEKQRDLLSGEQQELQQGLQCAEDRHRAVLSESQRRQDRIRELSKSQGAVRGRMEAERRLARHAEQDISESGRQLQDGERKIAAYQTERSQIEHEMAALAADGDVGIKEELARLTEEMSRIDAVRREGRDKLSKLADRSEQAGRQLEALRALLSQDDLALQKVELEREAMRERILSDYGEELLEELAGSDKSGATLVPEYRIELLEEVRRIKERISREGDVDATSIERYEEEQRRYDDLDLQRRDLDQAGGSLRRTIVRLQETLLERFLVTFERVNSNFSQLVPRLFGGGKGWIELLEPQRPLDSGVGIVARPPGKKLKSIELLSGGEKALCATALVLGIFMVRPSPLCILDEVDAPLDDANLVRFLSLIRELSVKTQFVVVTHNKNTMTAADKLVGITMEEPGATKLITVSLEDAVQQVA